MKPSAGIGYFYLLLSLVGGFFSVYHVFSGIIAANGAFHVVEFVQSTWTNNAYARAITWDFWVGTIAGSAFMVLEGRRLRMKYYGIFIVLSFMIAYAFAFPLFLYFRQEYLSQKTEPFI
jgi:hypothetical protein